MCGRFASSLPPEELRRFLGALGATPNHPPSWNVAPTHSALVARRDQGTGERRLDVLSWGLIPSFMQDPKGGRKPINARAETIASSGMFRGVFRARRCLVPMDAFYEWDTTPTGKQPWAFARADGTPLVMAGLWDIWKAPDGVVRQTFTIATTAANRFMSRIHDRMPVILEPAAWTLWLGEATGDPRDLLRPATEGVLRSWPVSRAVNSSRRDRSDLLEPVNLADAPWGHAETAAAPG